MKSLLVTQRVVVDARTRERRDALDQRWHKFLGACGLLALPVPNHLPSARRLLSTHSFGGVLLTGGNDLVVYGGDAPERDQVELFLLRHALDQKAPLIGVCRGMQLALTHFGVEQEPVEGHVDPHQTIEIDGAMVEVNSFHRWGCRETLDELPAWARAKDGVIKAVNHAEHALAGIMWHPERFERFRAADIALFRAFFGGVAL